MHNTKTKVCFLLGGYEDAGLARSVLELTKRIDRNSFEIAMVLCDNGPYANVLRENGIQCDILGTGWPPALRYNVGQSSKHHLFGYLQFPVWFLRTLRALVSYIKKNNVDIVHSNYYHFHFIAFIACIIKHCKCIWHWRGILKQKRLILFTRFLVRLAPHSVWSVANSYATADSIKPYVGSNLSVVYNGIEVPVSPEMTDRLAKICNISGNSRIVGLVASLSSIKGHIHFIEAASKICSEYNDVHFVYIGGHSAAGQQQYLQFLLGKKRELKLEDRLHFLGHRPDAFQLMADFEIATVCTLPPGEGFGMVIIEAMAQAVPVISTDQGAATELITDGVSGILIPPSDSNALAVAIKLLLDDKNRSGKIAQQARTECMNKFDIKNTVIQIENLYKEILSVN